MNRLTIAVAGALLVALAGCGPGDSGSLGTLPTDRPASTSPVSPTTPPADPSSGLGSGPSTPGPDGTTHQPDPAPPSTSTLTIELWFTKQNRLFPTARTRPYTVATSRLAMNELKAGPSSQEQAVGLGNGIASDLDFEVTVAGGVATVDVSAAFYADGQDVARLRQAQVVYTLTQFATVSTVGFQRNGEAMGSPVGRSDYADLLPLIVVTSPVIGQRVSSPVTIAGIANVHESTVSLRILDADGGEIATTFTTAAGRPGEYEVSVPYRLGTEQRGTVQVYSVSMEDGSRMHTVDIPVTLAPSR